MTDKQLEMLKWLLEDLECCNKCYNQVEINGRCTKRQGD